MTDAPLYGDRLPAQRNPHTGEFQRPLSGVLWRCTACGCVADREWWDCLGAGPDDATDDRYAFCPRCTADTIPEVVERVEFYVAKEKQDKAQRSLFA